MSDNTIQSIDAVIKMRAVEEILSTVTTSYATSKTLEVSYIRVRKWVERGRKRRRLFSRGGRPTALDTESVQAVREFLTLFPYATDGELKKKIKEEHSITVKRKLILLDDDSSTESELSMKLSRPTIKKYLRLFR
jgi:transposase